MAPPQSSPILPQLRNANTSSQHSSALSALKNELIGHFPRKQAWARMGVLERVVKDLSVSGGGGSSAANGEAARFQHPLQLASDEDAIRLHAIVIIASFAKGGPSFLLPLHSVRAIPAILGNITALSNPHEISTAALRAVTDIADAAALASSTSPITTQSLADQLFVPEHVRSLTTFLSKTSAEHHLCTQANLAIGLICRLCHEERHRQVLTAAGVLDLLASRLASFVVRESSVIPGADKRLKEDGLAEAHPDPAPSNATIGQLLDAIRTIVGTSGYRAGRLTFCPAITSVHPQLQEMDRLLPWTGLETPEPKSRENESPLIPWLIYLSRKCCDFDRLMAIALLAALLRADMQSKTSRERSVGILVVPVLLALIAKYEAQAPEYEKSGAMSNLRILEEAPAILALLISDNEFLQMQASECDAVPIISKLLKRAYAPAQPTMSAEYWSPEPESGMDVESSTPSARLGDAGQDPMLLHRVRVRSSVLKAIAALASGKEDYRKAIDEEEAIPYIVESLCEFPREPYHGSQRPQERSESETAATGPSPEYGTNTTAVMIAACHAVRTLSRSIKLLRTRLIDNDVKGPIFSFLQHDNEDLRMAATTAICNLVVEVSPVRDFLLERGVMRILCGLAHSDNRELRLDALWALKHLVNAAQPELKKSCLEQLGVDWLTRAVHGASSNGLPRDSLMGQSPGPSEGDVEMQTPNGPLRWYIVANGMPRTFDASNSERVLATEPALVALRDAELNLRRHAQNADMAIQEQALDFIRNLFGQPAPGLASESAAETAEMIDHVLNVFGKDQFFEMLAFKIRRRVQNAFDRRTPMPGRDAKVISPPAKIVISVVYILVHMAASIPRHRQLVTSQSEILKLLAQQLSSSDREVRISMCHLVSNLAEGDDGEEIQDVRERAQELKRMGYHTRMESLRQNDRDLEVRDRARLAVRQIVHATD